MIAIDPDDVLQDVADAFQMDVSSLNARWSRVVDRSVTQALTELGNILRGKGFTVTQIDSWDDGPVYARMLALFFAFVNGQGLNDYSDRDYNKLDCRKSLRELVSLSIGGNLSGPGA